MSGGHFIKWGLVAIGLAGCAAPVTSTEKFSARPAFSSDLAALVPSQKPRDAAVHRGIAALETGDDRAASRAFNQALQFDTNSSYLHFLNALAYHAMAVDGDLTQVPLAETGYLAALRLDPANTLAAYQLGLLYLENRQFDRAEAMLAQAVVSRGNDPAIYEALANASYYARDVKVASWSVDQAKRVGSARPSLFRTAALVDTIAGRDDDATHDYDLYVATKPPAESQTGLAQRMTELRDARDQQVAQFFSGASPAAATPSAVSATPTPTPTAVPPAAAGAGPALANWFDCGGPNAQNNAVASQPQMMSMPMSTSGTSSTTGTGPSDVGDPPVNLPALPSPCLGAGPPHMGVVDVVYIRTLEQAGTAEGVNLLSGLQAVLTGSISRSVTGGPTPANTLTRALGLALGNTTTAGINYSLNIANANDQRDDVIARPSLVAVDRQPSQFFSGANLSVALSGQYGGNIVQQPIGISLSMTPTFVDESSMLLAVKMARSSFAPITQGSGSFGSAIETTRNMTTVNVVLKFDQTLIISGLSLNENQTNADQVPGLGSVPGLQYFFARKTATQTNEALIVLLTPRQPTYGDQLPPVTPAGFRLSLDELRKRVQSGFKSVNNIDSIARGLESNPFYLTARTGDVTTEQWIAPPSLEHTIHDVVRLLYF